MKKNMQILCEKKRNTANIWCCFLTEDGESPSTFLKMSKYNKIWTNLSCRRDSARGHADGVDASVGVLVDLDVGSLFSGFGVSCCVEQVQHFLVVQLERMLKDKETHKRRNQPS